MRILFAAVLISLWSISSVSMADQASSIRVADPNGGALDRNVYISVERFVEINADVRDGDLRVEDNRALLGGYISLINDRFKGDLADNQLSLSDSSVNYAVLMVSNSDDFVVIVRVGSVGSGGAFESLPGLVYRFDRETRNILNVSPSFF